jgi:trans-aconitate methyltransferase
MSEILQSRQVWNAQDYASNARFVSDLGAPVFALLSAKAGERILDLGCGDGVLAKRLIEIGCEVIGIDDSEEMVAAAGDLGIDAVACDAQDLSYAAEFDAVFSNAALHWMKRADDVIAGVWRALKPGGRFVAEFGGHGCVDRILGAIAAELAVRDIDALTLNPWYFPTVQDYRKKLEAVGFSVAYIELIPRPTPLPGDVTCWLDTFAKCFTLALPATERMEFLQDVREALRPELCDNDGNWTADYVRLRFMATRLCS